MKDATASCGGLYEHDKQVSMAALSALRYDIYGFLKGGRKARCFWGLHSGLTIWRLRKRLLVSGVIWLLLQITDLFQSFVSMPAAGNRAQLLLC